MKRIITLIAAIIFSIVFYKQSIGLNLLLFTITTIACLFIIYSKQLKSKKIIGYTLAYLITGFAVFFQKSNLTIIANIISFFIVIGTFSEKETSIYIKWLNGIYTSIVSVFSIHFEKQQEEKRNKRIKLSNLKIIIPSIIVFIVFFILYSNGNPIFSDLISKIDLSFINFTWLLFTVLGYYLFNNILNPIKIEPATGLDLETGNLLLKNDLKEISKNTLKSENKLGTILILMLNILIVLFLITDYIYISQLHYLSASELSQQVHSGVYTLILSIVLAIVIILYFFRGHLNFYKKNKQLKILTFIWIWLNIILCISTATKNIEYITSFGLTYKRIGVLVYLFLALIGLLTTFIKVNQQKNIWYLLRLNTSIAFVLLIISTSINWDAKISKYNLYSSEIIDMDYLLNLSNNNTFTLKEYLENGNQISLKQQLDIEKKHKEYVLQLKENKWQELIYDNLTVE